MAKASDAMFISHFSLALTSSCRTSSGGESLGCDGHVMPAFPSNKMTLVLNRTAVRDSAQKVHPTHNSSMDCFPAINHVVEHLDYDYFEL